MPPPPAPKPTPAPPTIKLADTLRDLPAIPPTTAEVEPMTLLHRAWILLASIDQGQWDSQTAEWQADAYLWRDEYHLCAIQNPEAIAQESEHSEVLIMTAEGVKKGKMRHSIVGDAPQTIAAGKTAPKMLDLNKY